MRAALYLLLLSACAGTPKREPSSTTKKTDGPTAPLALTYLGVAGWQLESGDVTILVDPYFSRPNLDGEIKSDPAAVAARAPKKANLIVVGHSHVDHLLDAPAVALATGAQIMGSASTAKVATSAGVPADHVIPIQGGEDYQFDGYSVRVIPSLHSALDDKHFMQGQPITVLPPKTFDDYTDGGTFDYLVRVGGREILVTSTANFIERELVGVHPDVAIIAPGLREQVYDYTCRLMRVLDYPQVVYTTHFDDWRAAPTDEEPDADLEAFVDEVKRCSPATQVIIPKHFVRMSAP
ncbi:MAG: MBL fold metallo-hydrolase [Kofleriaceae bacterium]|nr:MBL fold metallo-hydrolase [Kofleriaceae bacterium]